MLIQRLLLFPWFKSYVSSNCRIRLGCLLFLMYLNRPIELDWKIRPLFFYIIWRLLLVITSSMILDRDQHWLDQLLIFRELLILSLRILASKTASIYQNVKNIRRCQDLRVINCDFGELDNIEMLINIARGCLLLQIFRVWPGGCRIEPGVVNSLLSDLFHAPPCLEYLALCLEFQMDGAIFEDLARHCPQLVTGYGLDFGCRPCPQPSSK